MSGTQQFTFTLEHLDRVLDRFEDFCAVTQSVRSGFPVSVTVRDGAGKVLRASIAAQFERIAISRISGFGETVEGYAVPVLNANANAKCGPAPAGTANAA